MLAPRASSAFICIRCELQLARPRVPALNRRIARSNFSASSRCRDEEQSTKTQSATAHDQFGHQPSERMRRRKHRPVEKTTERLGGMKTLGADAEILVLKERAESPPEPPTISEITPELQSAHEILASLQQDDRMLTPAELQQQIDSLRPNAVDNIDGPHYVTQSTFLKLVNVLSRGFTARQLSQYYSATKGVQQDNVRKEVLDVLKARKSEVNSSLARTDWHPGTTQINRRLPGLDVTIRPKLKPFSKKTLVDQILRDVWKLVLLEELEAPGEIELSLKPWQLVLLNQGESDTALDRVGSSRMAKIEIFRPHNVVRVTADKTTAEYTANDIEQLLENTESREFNRTPWYPYLIEDQLSQDKKIAGVFSKAELRMVSSLTHTIIQENHEQILIIRGLNKSSIDEAETYLLKLLPLKQPTITRTIDPEKLLTAKDQGYLLPISQRQESLHREFRDSNLGRWVFPIKRSIEPGVESDMAAGAEESSDPVVSDDSMLERTFSALEPTYNQYMSQKTPTDTDTWASCREFVLLAQYGQVIFPMKDGQSYPGSQDTRFSSSRRPFWHTFPGLFELFIRRNTRAHYRPSLPVLEYQFIPAPTQQDSGTVQIYPSLSVEIDHDSDGKPEFAALKLDLEQTIHDVLLPDQPTDIRFKLQSKLEMKRAPEDPNVSEFLEAVYANVESGGRLRAPALKLAIPKWTIGGYAPHTPGTELVEYLFAGVQYRQTMLMGNKENPSTTLSYSTVESGKLGRRGGMLMAQFNSQGESTQIDHIPNEEDFKAFIKSGFDFVGLIREASVTRPGSNPRTKPRDENSARKLGRRAQRENPPSLSP